MVLEIGLVHDIVHETCRVFDAGCIRCWIRTVKSQMEVEVRILLFDFRIVFEVESLDKATSAIEEVHCPLGVQSLEQMHDVAAKRSHACATAHEDIFHVLRIILWQQEFSERTGNPHLVARLAREHVG